MERQLPGDPAVWTVSQVSLWVRYGLPQMLAAVPNVALPDAEQLATRFEEEEVAGYVLLADVDASFLQTACGLKTLGRRSAVYEAIRRLKKISEDGTLQSYALPGLDTDSQDTVTPPRSETNEGPEDLMTNQNNLPEIVTDTADDHAALAVKPVDVIDRPATKRQRSASPTRQEGTTKRRRLDLTAMTTMKASIDANTRRLSAKSHRADKLTVRELFYGDNEPVAEIKWLDQTGDDDELAFHKTSEQTDHRIFAFRHITRAFKTQQTDAVHFRGEIRNVYLPYNRAAGRDRKRRRDRIKIEVTQDMTVFAADEDDDTTFMIDEHTLGTGEWDFVTRKSDTIVEDELLPLYKDSESISDISSRFAKELEEEEKALQKLKKAFLDIAKATILVEDIVEDYASDWKQKKLTRLEAAEAYKIWRSARSSRAGRRRLQRYKDDLAHLQQRLSNMKRDILHHQWKDEDELAGQCRIFRPTVEDMMETSWKVEVCERPIPPSKPARIRNEASEPKRSSEEQRATSPSNAHADANGGAQTDVADFVIDDDSNMVDATEGRDAILNNLESAHEEIFDDDVPLSGDEVHHTNDASQPEDRLTPDLAMDDARPQFETSSDGPDAIQDLKDAAAMSDDEPSFMPDSDDTLPSCNEMHRNRISRSQVKQEAEHRSGTLWSTTNNDIIAISSDSADTPVKPRRKPRSKSRKPPSGDPENSTYSDIVGWDLDELIESSDRKRVILKLLLSLEKPLISSLNEKLSTQTDASAYISKSLATYLQNRFAGSCSPSSPNDRISQLARLYACWEKCNHSCWDSGVPSELWQPNEQSLSHCANFLAVVIPKIAEMKEVSEEIVSIGSSEVEAEIQAEQEVESDDAPRRPGKNRSRKLDKRATTIRIEAAGRMARFEQESQLRNDSQSQPEALLSDDLEEKIIVNVIKEEGEADVYLPQHLVKVLKGHQIDGVRFLWREMTVTDADGGQGCVLAHTMGLGKTCQTLAFLATLKQARDASETRKLVPKAIRGLHIIVLCPPSILQNWMRELQQWAPKHFKPYKIDSTVEPINRLTILRLWATTNDSILFIGYSMFLQLAKAPTEVKSPSEGKPGETDSGSAQTSDEGPSGKKLTAKQLAVARKYLLEGPDIVIADEAHQLRTPTAKITQEVKNIRTERRIALTGTPLNNDTQEMFSLMDWVSPGFLGDAAEFRHRFARPIEEGMYADSSAGERRRCLVKLAVLSKETAPKINRANITVLKGSLPSKYEFNLTVPLTDLQMKLYKELLVLLRRNLEEDEEVSQSQLFGWLSLLKVLVNHPGAFRKKLQQRGEPSAPKKGKKQSLEVDSLPLGQVNDPTAMMDEPVSAMGLTQEMINRMLDLIPEDVDYKGSYRMVLIKMILEHARKAKEQTLIFSQSLPTLDVLQKMVKKDMGMSCGRIDGSVSMDRRDAAVRRFAAGDDQVMVISTRAGGQGLNLQTASRVIIVDFGFNPAWEEQAVGRAYRMGQQRDVFIYHFMAGGTFEEKLYNSKLFKNALFQRVVDKKSTGRHARRSAKEWLFPPTPVVMGDVSSEAGKDKLILDKIMEAQNKPNRAAMIYNIKTTETLQKVEEEEPLTAEEQLLVAEESISLQSRKAPLSTALAAMAGASASQSTAARLVGYHPGPVLGNIPHTSHRPPAASPQAPPSRSLPNLPRSPAVSSTAPVSASTGATGGISKAPPGHKEFRPFLSPPRPSHRTVSNSSPSSPHQPTNSPRRSLPPPGRVNGSPHHHGSPLPGLMGAQARSFTSSSQHTGYGASRPTFTGSIAFQPPPGLGDTSGQQPPPSTQQP